MTFFDLKQGQDLENRAAHPHQEFPRVPPGFKRQLNEPLSRFLLHFMFKFKLFNKCFFSQNGTANSPPLCYFSSVVKKHSQQGRMSCLSIAPLTQEPEKIENHTLSSGTSPSIPPPYPLLIAKRTFNAILNKKEKRTLICKF